MGAAQMDHRRCRRRMARRGPGRNWAALSPKRRHYAIHRPVLPPPSLRERTELFGVVQDHARQRIELADPRARARARPWCGRSPRPSAVRAWPDDRLPHGVGLRARREAQLQKKTLIAAEQDRPDVARRRAQWSKYRDRIDPSRLVFIDETGQRPIWLRCGAGHRTANGSKLRYRMAIGRP